ncbi:MAG TPA: DUF1614 domain-containing protein [Ktedonobacterales bacterium]|nr:DUF1614 domain-containing protein [Ktedonobacterales bacterium]
MIVFALPFLFLLGFFILLVVLIVLIQLRVLSYAYRKIGVPPRYMLLVLLLSLIGSGINLPLYVDHGSVVAINVGGALLPILLSLYLFTRTGLQGRMIIATAIVAIIVHALAGIVPGRGIAVPILVPPIAAAAVALLLSFRRAPPVAYVAGSMGTLIGADIMNLHRVVELGAPMLSIGGAGKFDAVFLTGIIAGLIT